MWVEFFQKTKTSYIKKPVVLLTSNFRKLVSDSDALRYLIFLNKFINETIIPSTLEYRPTPIQIIWTYLMEVLDPNETSRNFKSFFIFEQKNLNFTFQKIKNEHRFS